MEGTMQETKEAFFVCDLHNSTLSINVLITILPILKKEGYITLLIEAFKVDGEEEKLQINLAEKYIVLLQKKGINLRDLAKESFENTPPDIKQKIINLLKRKFYGDLTDVIPYLYTAVRRLEYNKHKLVLYNQCKQLGITLIPIDVEDPAKRLISDRNNYMAQKALAEYQQTQKAVIFLGSNHFFTTTDRRDRSKRFTGVQQQLSDKNVTLKKAIFPIEEKLRSLWTQVLHGEYKGNDYFTFPVSGELAKAVYMSDIKELPGTYEELINWQGSFDFSNNIFTKKTENDKTPAKLVSSSLSSVLSSHATITTPTRIASTTQTSQDNEEDNESSQIAHAL